MAYCIHSVAVKLSPILLQALQVAADHIQNCHEKFSVVGEDELMLCAEHRNINAHVRRAELHKRRQFCLLAYISAGRQ